MMDFKIITDLSALPQIIETNAEELKAWLSERMAHYNGLVVTADNIQEAKDDKTALNKLRAALEERRKEVKRLCMAPYEAFEKKYKELLALIDEPIKSIDTQVKAFEDQALSEKYNRLEDYFSKCICSMDVPVKLNFDSILNPKWKNKSMKESALQREIYETLCRIQDDVQEIKEYYTDSPHLTAVLDCYMQGYDKGCALAYAAALVQQEQRRQEQEAQRNAQQNFSTPLPQPTQEAYDPEPTVQEPPAPSPDAQRLGKIVFRAIGTRAQITALVAYMNANGIQYEAVKVKE